jgi:hypothetical protein
MLGCLFHTFQSDAFRHLLLHEGLGEALNVGCRQSYACAGYALSFSSNSCTSVQGFHGKVKLLEILEIEARSSTRW